MKNTKTILEKIREILNTNTRCQEMMQMLSNKANEENWTNEQWEEMKTKMLEMLFYTMALKMPEIREGIAKDIYNELTAE